MPTLTSNMWKGDVNTKVPGLSHYFTYRVTGANFAANGSTTFALPGNYNLLGQYTPAQAPTNFAQTSSPYDVNSEPQFAGAVFVPTNVSIRNANGTFVSTGAGAAGSATIAMYNSNILSYNAGTGVVTRGAAGLLPVNTYVATSWTAATTAQAWSLESVWSSAIPGQPVAPVVAANQVTTAATMTELTTSAPGFTVAPVRFGLGDQLAMNLTVASIAGATPPTATQFTVDCFGYWIQGF